MDTIKERIKTLADKRRIALSKLDSVLGFGNGTIGKWSKYVPSADKLEKVADYFDVSVDYLLGRVPFAENDLTCWVPESKIDQQIDKVNEVAFDMSFGQRLMQVRQSKQMTQSEFARPLSVSASYISSLENGKVNPSSGFVLALLIVYNINLDWLRTGEGPMGYNSMTNIYAFPPGTFRADNEYVRNLEIIEVLQCMAKLFSFGYPNCYDMIEDLSRYNAYDFVILLNLLMREWADRSKKDKIDIELKIEELLPKRKRSICVLAGRIPPTLKQLEITDEPIIIVDDRTAIALGDDVRKGDLGVIAVDDSMIDAGIQEGDLCIIHPQETVENGEIALVSYSFLDNHNTIRKFYRMDDGYRLVPCNPKYEDDVLFSGPIRIWGKFIKVVHDDYKQ